MVFYQVKIIWKISYYNYTVTPTYIYDFKSLEELKEDILIPYKKYELFFVKGQEARLFHSPPLSKFLRISQL